MLGDVTRHDRPQMPNCRVRHRSSTREGTGELARGLNRPSLGVGVVYPDSRESGESERVYPDDFRRAWVRKVKAFVRLLIQVPPKSKTMTTNGSRIAPTPIVGMFRRSHSITESIGRVKGGQVYISMPRNRCRKRTGKQENKEHQKKRYSIDQKVLRMPSEGKAA